MRKFIFLLLSLLPLLLVVTGGFTVQLLNSSLQNSLRGKTLILGINSPEKTPGFPIRLQIPAINIDTRIENVVLNSKGEMGVPVNADNAGWFSLGLRPGEAGSAVLDGHLNSPEGQGGVFANLGKLRPGDQVYLTDDKDNTWVFVVRSSQSFDPGYADNIFTRSTGVKLNLITCSGSWNKNQRSYTKRLVVFTDLLD